MGATTVTNTVSDFRGNTPEKPVWRSVVTQMVWANGATTAETIASTIGVNGVIQRIKVTYSAAANNPTIELMIKDLDSNTLSTTGEKADGSTHIWKADGTDFKQNELAFFNGFIVMCQISADPGVGGLTADIEIVGI